MRFHIRDDLYLECGRIRTGQLATAGRLAAEYTLVENAFTTPLDDELLARRADQRTARLDGYSPIDAASWSQSGSTAAWAECS